MSVSVTFNSAHRILLASEFFMARRPVLDRAQNLAAYELLFCSIEATGVTGVNEAAEAAEAHDVSESCSASVEDHQPATASVIADVYQHGMARVIGDMTGILYIDSAALMSEIFQFLPPQKVLLGLAELPEVSPCVVARMTALSRAGFRFILTADGQGGDMQPLLPLIGTVRIDVTGKSREELQHFCAFFHSQGKRLLAEHVDSPDQYQICHELGFDLFRGYFFAQPALAEEKKLTPSQTAMIALLALLASDADNAVIEESIKGDISLGLNLMRLVNTPAVSPHRIDSLRQALMVLGRNQLQRWLQITLYAESASGTKGIMPLLAMAATRARLIELIAQNLRPGNRGIADTGFTVGIMSLMEPLFSMPMERILGQIPVIDEVSDALLNRQGYFGKLLALAEHAEWHQKNDARLPHAIREFNLSSNDLYMLQLAAYEWSDHVMAGLH